MSGIPASRSFITLGPLSLVGGGGESLGSYYIIFQPELASALINYVIVSALKGYFVQE